MAEAYWKSAAENGDPAAQHNLGVLWENWPGNYHDNRRLAASWYLKAAQQGYAPSMTSLARIQLSLGYRESAISWLQLAARWKDSDAVLKLIELGQPVPQADLHNRALAQQQAQQQDDISMGVAALYLVSSFAEGYTNSRKERLLEQQIQQQVQAQEQKKVPTYVSPPLGTYFARPNALDQTPAYECSSDFSCRSGQRCLKEPLKSRGVCVDRVDGRGFKDFGRDLDSIGPGEAQCSTSSDCPTGFTCDSKYKQCVY